MRQTVTYEADDDLIDAEARILRFDVRACVHGDYLQFVDDETGERFIISGIDWAAINADLVSLRRRILTPEAR